LPESPLPKYVSRSGHKLAAALDAFGISPAGRVCADLGSNVGGFVDCLLQRGAAKIYAIDTGYGTLAWKLRTDPRVVVMERSNAMHVTLPEPVDLVTIDVAWTPQHRILPNALKLLKPGGRIITLIKPHYEADRRQLRGGVLPPEEIPGVLQAVSQRLASAGITLHQMIESPISGHKGNTEYLALAKPAEQGKY
jgi:23S rRNA (cytidine1920-2'-O)/16S rRNA (cytidine1409-2'-O)-methyltransferase